jgi:PBP1b-binding outer membrane lipoprotein LpoB
MEGISKTVLRKLRKKNNLKKKIVIAVVGAIALALFLSGCGGGGSTETATPTVTVTETTKPDVYEPEPSGFTNAEDEFLSDVHGVGNSVIESNSDEQIVSVGHTVCDTLDDGNTVSDVSNYLISTGDYTTDNDIEFVATMIAGAVVNLCPEYEYQID